MLHKGHERLLSKAFELGSVVFVGVSGDAFVSSLHKGHPVKSFSSRSLRIRRFLRSHGWLGRARIVELKDPFGPAIARKEIEALVVSGDTRSSGATANTIRSARKLRPLRLYVVDMVRAEDGGPISVTRMMRGEVDAKGRLRS